MSTADTPQNDVGEVEAGPTKQFFVSMITRDIALQPAVVDLVDNSVDGARRLRGDGPLEGLEVDLRYDAQHFQIEDNCGGIPLEVARHYAFKFGRPDDAPGIPHSVGQFGIGMKRALFKLGTQFSVRSASEGSAFSLHVNVPEWQQDSANWNFPLDTAEEAPRPAAKTGTTLTVTELRPEVSEDFALDMFSTGLVAELRAKHRVSIGRGLRVAVNGVVVEPWPIELLAGEQLSPSRLTTTYAAKRPAPVVVTVVAGVGESVPTEAGWYVFCNGRLVLGPDQTNVTGWGEGRGRTIPRFHTQFARFRGFVFFESDRAALLPITTTKVGVDTTSPVWRSTRLQLLQLARPVIDFLNAIDWENPQVRGNDVGELRQVVDDALPVGVGSLPDTDVAFRAPERGSLVPPPMTSSVQYRRLLDEIDRAKELLGVTSNADVGNRTFEYYLEAEG